MKKNLASLGCIPKVSIADASLARALAEALLAAEVASVEQVQQARDAGASFFSISGTSRLCMPHCSKKRK